ncbi:MAG: LysM peptidoglycan-binding domain-containing protein [Clostridiales bacterium]|nr:LysM peptidoglycan-binding domain-containing protein [Clostridiales bacterium]
MVIHVIEPGETAYTIANEYGVSAQWIIRENGIVNPLDLAVGNALVILFPKITHTIVEGDTLEKIAQMYNVTIMDLLRNNSYLSDLEYLQVGDVIVIEYEDEKKSNLTVTGYSYHFTDERVLRKTLPYLTYLMISSLYIDENGIIRENDDKRVIEYSKVYGVAPILSIEFKNKGSKKATDVLHSILNDAILRDAIIEGITTVLVKKGYSGVGFGPVYVYPSDREKYIEFMNEIISCVHNLGLIVIDTTIPKTFGLISDVFSTYNYIFSVNQLTDLSVVFPYSVGLSIVAPTGISSYHALIDMINYVLDYIEPDILQLGINTVGYIWELPYIPGESEGNAISVTSAVQLAKDFDIPIQFDEGTQAAFFSYEDGNREYLIRYRDARSIATYMNVVDEYDLRGIGVWNITSFFNGLWLIVNSQYKIDKIDL